MKLPTDELQKKVLRVIVRKNLNVKKTEELIENELIKITENNLAKDGKKRIKGIFTPKVYINTVKQVFDKYGVTAQYTSKELEDRIQITVTIPKK